MKARASLAVVLYGVWLLVSGHYTPLLLVLGAVSVLVSVGVAARMGVVDRQGSPLAFHPRILLYLPWLLLEILKANVDVARRILTPGLPIRPSILRVPTDQRTEVGRVIYANSITLTPGTVSVNVEGETITVHALTREAAEGLAAGEMNRRVTAAEHAR